ncbi:MAG: aminoglycoside phosphotransferase family protein [Cryobacterium sp.]|nr:aminoglycoside phosphotransferase family protein [Cryobacterium sp.]
MAVPIARSFDIDALSRNVDAEGHGAQLDSAVLQAGSQNVVLETDDLIVRFPRDESVSVDWEANLLRFVQGRTRFETPEVLWLGVETRCMAYRKIAGTQFDRRAYVAETAATRSAFADSLAESLVEVQDALAAATDAGAELPVDDFSKFYRPLREGLSAFPAEAQAPMSDLLDEYEATFLSGERRVPVAMHNDFHFGNLVLDGPLGRVIGLWDFSCAAFGVAAWDLRYFEGDLASPWEVPVHAPGEHLDLLHRVVRSYGELRGTSIDARACVVANRVEALFDLSVTGAEDALRAWALWDATKAG